MQPFENAVGPVARRPTSQKQIPNSASNSPNEREAESFMIFATSANPMRSILIFLLFILQFFLIQ
jgi:hypothetical protein